MTMALETVAPQALWQNTVIAFGSVIAHTAVLLVFQLGQPRIFFSMARDGLLPSTFASVHPRFKTPHVTTIMTGVAVGGIAAFATVDEMVSLTNIGTLFAFILVCVGVMVLRHKDPNRERPFRVPLGPYLLPGLGAVSGCGGGAFCPTSPIARDQMAVFLLRVLDPALVPPPCGVPVFGDVPASSPFCRWVEELARRGITGGCSSSPPLFCPAAPVTRGQMAVFCTATFDLRLYGP